MDGRGGPVGPRPPGRDIQNTIRLIGRNLSAPKTVDLSGSSITDELSQELAKSLAVNQHLVSLNIQGNTIGDDGAKAIADALKTNKSLALLNMSSNNVTDSGCRFLGEALEANDSLEDLNLCRNNLSSVGVAHIAKGLRKNRGLSTLNLGDNDVKNPGALAIADCLEENSTLFKITLWNCGITEEAAKVILEKLLRDPNVRQIELENNPGVSNDTVRRFRAAAFGELEDLPTLEGGGAGSADADGSKAIAKGKMSVTVMEDPLHVGPKSDSSAEKPRSKMKARRLSKAFGKGKQKDSQIGARKGGEKEGESGRLSAETLAEVKGDPLALEALRERLRKKQELKEQQERNELKQHEKDVAPAAEDAPAAAVSKAPVTPAVPDSAAPVEPPAGPAVSEDASQPADASEHVIESKPAEPIGRPPSPKREVAAEAAPAVRVVENEATEEKPELAEVDEDERKRLEDERLRQEEESLMAAELAEMGELSGSDDSDDEGAQRLRSFIREEKKKAEEREAERKRIQEEAEMMARECEDMSTDMSADDEDEKEQDVLMGLENAKLKELEDAEARDKRIQDEAEKRTRAEEEARMLADLEEMDVDSDSENERDNVPEPIEIPAPKEMTILEHVESDVISRDAASNAAGSPGALGTPGLVSLPGLGFKIKPLVKTEKPPPPRRVFRRLFTKKEKEARTPSGTPSPAVDESTDEHAMYLIRRLRALGANLPTGCEEQTFRKSGYIREIKKIEDLSLNELEVSAVISALENEVTGKNGPSPVKEKVSPARSTPPPADSPPKESRDAGALPSLIEDQMSEKPPEKQADVLASRRPDITLKAGRAKLGGGMFGSVVGGGSFAGPGGFLGSQDEEDEEDDIPDGMSLFEFLNQELDKQRKDDQKKDDLKKDEKDKKKDEKPDSSKPVDVQKRVEDRKGEMDAEISSAMNFLASMSKKKPKSKGKDKDKKHSLDIQRAEDKDRKKGKRRGKDKEEPSPVPASKLKIEVKASDQSSKKDPLSVDAAVSTQSVMETDASGRSGTVSTPFSATKEEEDDDDDGMSFFEFLNSELAAQGSKDEPKSKIALEKDKKSEKSVTQSTMVKRGKPKKEEKKKDEKKDKRKKHTRTGSKDIQNDITMSVMGKVRLNANAQREMEQEIQRVRKEEQERMRAELEMEFQSELEKREMEAKMRQEIEERLRRQFLDKMRRELAENMKKEIEEKMRKEFEMANQSMALPKPGEESPESSPSSGEVAARERRKRREERERMREEREKEREKEQQDEEEDGRFEGVVLSRDHIKLGKLLGQGAFGDVLLGKYLGTKVAVKQLRVANANAEAEKNFKEEFFAMKDLRHPNIILLMGIVVKPPPFLIVTEFAGRGSLYDIIHERREPLSLWRLHYLLTQCARGMAYLHGRKPQVIHRDLKTANLLITKEWQVKIGDFGLSKVRNEFSDVAQSVVGTCLWMAPEVMEGNEYTAMCDVYSYAIIMWEVFEAKLPFKGLNQMQVMFKVARGERPPFVRTPVAYQPLIQRLWDGNPSRRLPFYEVLEFLEDIEDDLELSDENPNPGGYVPAFATDAQAGSEH